MSEDVITNNFAGYVDRNVIRRNLILVRIVLILLSIYILADFLYWYRYISYIINMPKTAFAFFVFKVEPIILLFQILLQIVCWSFHYKAQKIFLTAFENEDAGLFNKGYTIVFRLNIINIVSISLTIMAVLLRFVLHPNA